MPLKKRGHLEKRAGYQQVSRRCPFSSQRYLFRRKLARDWRRCERPLLSLSPPAAPRRSSHFGRALPGQPSRLLTETRSKERANQKAGTAAAAGERCGSLACRWVGLKGLGNEGGGGGDA